MLRSAPSGGDATAQNGTFNTLTVTGRGLFADGSQSAPSISFISNPTLGLWTTTGIVVINTNSARGLLVASNAGFSQAELGANGLHVGPGAVIGFTPTTDTGNNNDALFTRDAVGLLGAQNSIAVRGGAGFGMKAITGSYSVVQNDFTICCSTATAGLTVLLPLSPAMNQYLNIKKVSADVNRLIIDGNGNLIDALSTQSTILATRPNFALQFGSTVASPTGSAWQLL